MHTKDNSKPCYESIVINSYVRVRIHIPLPEFYQIPSNICRNKINDCFSIVFLLNSSSFSAHSTSEIHIPKMLECNQFDPMEEKSQFASQ